MEDIFTKNQVTLTLTLPVSDFYVHYILIDKVLLLADKCSDSVWVRESK